MSEQKEQTRNSSLAGIVLLPVLLLFYVLSLGPLARLVESGLLGDPRGLPIRILQIIYYPLIWVCENYEPVGNFVFLYLQWWIDL